MLNEEQLKTIFELNKDKIEPLVRLGILFDEKTAKVRNGNQGKSNYYTLLIQAWSIMNEHSEWTYQEGDIQKRLLRTKAEGGMSQLEARLLDFKKMKHNLEELIRIWEYKVADEKEQQQLGMTNAQIVTK